MSLPTDLIADTLNKRARKHDRVRTDNEAIPRLHVSSLIKSDSADFFCPREFVLRYMERRETGGGAIPPKFELLYAVGHFYGNYIVQKFIERNKDYGKYAWGDWSCTCGATKRTRVTFAEVEDLSCPTCKQPVHNYIETDLFDPKKWVVGHADLILKVGDVYYIYEFKTIDRADIVFANIAAPLGDHLLQASHYYYMLKAEGKRVHNIIRFVYVDRSMSGLYTEKPFREVYGRAIEADRLRRIYVRAKTCHSSIKEGVLPERKCKEIECSRAKQCTVAVSCFARASDKVFRIPADLTHPLPRSESTVRRSKAKTGMRSRSEPKPAVVLTQRAQSVLPKKSLRKSRP